MTTLKVTLLILDQDVMSKVSLLQAASLDLGNYVMTEYSWPSGHITYNTYESHFIDLKSTRISCLLARVRALKLVASGSAWQHRLKRPGWADMFLFIQTCM